jgi:hypothetical protein
MRFYLCAPLSSMGPSMLSGGVALMGLFDCLQLFPTPGEKTELSTIERGSTP